MLILCLPSDFLVWEIQQHFGECLGRRGELEPSFALCLVHLVRGKPGFLCCVSGQSAPQPVLMLQ